MAVTKVIKCDKCNNIIFEEEGIRIHGNIYSVMFNNQRGALIGNNIEEDEEGNISNIKIVDFCCECFLNAMTEKFKNKCEEYLTERERKF